MKSKFRFNLRDLFAVIMVIAVLCAILIPTVAAAADRGPQKQTTLVSTNSDPASVAIPIGDTGRFTPEWLVVRGTWLVGTNAVTQTVSYVSASYTGTVRAVTADTSVGLTNIPTMFSGDKFLITTTGLGANTNSVVIIGRVFD